MLDFGNFSTKLKSWINSVAWVWLYFHPNASFTNFTINNFNVRCNIYRIKMIYTSDYKIRCMKSLEFTNETNYLIVRLKWTFMIVKCVLPVEILSLESLSETHSAFQLFDLVRLKHNYHNHPMWLDFLHLSSKCWCKGLKLVRKLSMRLPLFTDNWWYMVIASLPFLNEFAVIKILIIAII